jgi:CDP-diacylglycerol---glycerol-3-phosphate 3-phosphatidyltransferase
MLNIPNILTLFRILCIPFIIVIFYLPVNGSSYVAGTLFGLACLTDWLDGYLARLLKQTSSLGAFLDPVADKLIVSICLVLLVSKQELAYITIPSLIIIGREIVISALREWMAELGKRQRIAVNYIGKFKTATQMIAIGLLLGFWPGTHPFFLYVGYFLLYIAAILTIWSMFVYLKSAYEVIIEKRN